MTEQAMQRAQQIDAEKARLKQSLCELLKARIFSVDDGSNPFRGSTDPFLADLEVSTRSFAANAINKRIKELDAEFKKL